MTLRFSVIPAWIIRSVHDPIPVSSPHLWLFLPPCRLTNLSTCGAIHQLGHPRIDRVWARDACAALERFCFGANIPLLTSGRSPRTPFSGVRGGADFGIHQCGVKC
ncbi:hypothetical protein TNCV_2889681 [Trichonephila clavipes]|nr:hypothetical protein TNCV_2889681 [Trichonephila clavipes]